MTDRQGELFPADGEQSLFGWDDVALLDGIAAQASDADRDALDELRRWSR